MCMEGFKLRSVQVDITLVRPKMAAGETEKTLRPQCERMKSESDRADMGIKGAISAC